MKTRGPSLFPNFEPIRVACKISSFGTFPISEEVKERLGKLIIAWLAASSSSNLYFGSLILPIAPCYVSDHALSQSPNITSLPVLINRPCNIGAYISSIWTGNYSE